MSLAVIRGHRVCRFRTGGPPDKCVTPPPLLAHDGGHIPHNVALGDLSLLDCWRSPIEIAGSSTGTERSTEEARSDASPTQSPLDDASHRRSATNGRRIERDAWRAFAQTSRRKLQSASIRRKDAELVAFGVCQDNPRCITLANINTLGAMSHQASHLGVLVVGPEVEMQSALGLLALIKPDEVQPRDAIRPGADLELVSRGVDHNPTKSLSPPLPQGRWIYTVNNNLFPFQGHPPRLDLPEALDTRHFHVMPPSRTTSSTSSDSVTTDRRADDLVSCSTPQLLDGPREASQGVAVDDDSTAQQPHDRRTGHPVVGDSDVRDRKLPRERTAR